MPKIYKSRYPRRSSFQPELQPLQEEDEGIETREVIESPVPVDLPQIESGGSYADTLEQIQLEEMARANTEEIRREEARAARPESDMTRAAEARSLGEREWAEPNAPSTVPPIPRRPYAQGAIPKAQPPPSREELESRVAVEELEKIVGRVSPMRGGEKLRPAPLRNAIVAQTGGPREWDCPESGPSTQEWPMLRGPSGKRRRYNPRRHLEDEDYVSLRDQERERSPTPPPIGKRCTPTDGSRGRRENPFRIPAPRETPVEIQEPPARREQIREPPTRREPVREPSSQHAARLPAAAGAPKLRGALFGGLTPVPIDPAVDPPAHACFNCWKKGHTRFECPRPQAKFCFNCGRVDTNLRECPRCAEAHAQYLKEKEQKATKTVPPTPAPRAMPEGRPQPVPRARSRTRWDAQTGTPAPSQIAPATATVTSTQAPPTPSILEVLRQVQHLPPDLQEAILREAYGRDAKR